MESAPPPIRISSKTAIEKHELQLRETRKELLSKISSAEEPISYRKLTIEEVQVLLEEQRIHKSWLDIKQEQRCRGIRSSAAYPSIIPTRSGFEPLTCPTPSWLTTFLEVAREHR